MFDKYSYTYLIKIQKELRAQISVFRHETLKLLTLSLCYN